MHNLKCTKQSAYLLRKARRTIQQSHCVRIPKLPEFLSLNPPSLSLLEKRKKNYLQHHAYSHHIVNKKLSTNNITFLEQLEQIKHHLFDGMSTKKKHVPASIQYKDINRNKEFPTHVKLQIMDIDRIPSDTLIHLFLVKLVKNVPAEKCISLASRISIYRDFPTPVRYYQLYHDIRSLVGHALEPEICAIMPRIQQIISVPYMVDYIRRYSEFSSEFIASTVDHFYDQRTFDFVRYPNNKPRRIPLFLKQPKALLSFVQLMKNSTVKRMLLYYLNPSPQHQKLLDTCNHSFIHIYKHVRSLHMTNPHLASRIEEKIVHMDNASTDLCTVPMRHSKNRIPMMYQPSNELYRTITEGDPDTIELQLEMLYSDLLWQQQKLTSDIVSSTIIPRVDMSQHTTVPIHTKEMNKSQTYVNMQYIQVAQQHKTTCVETPTFHKTQPLNVIESKVPYAALHQEQLKNYYEYQINSVNEISELAVDLNPQYSKHQEDTLENNDRPWWKCVRNKRFFLFRKQRYLFTATTGWIRIGKRVDKETTRIKSIRVDSMKPNTTQHWKQGLLNIRCKIIRKKEINE